MRRARFVTIVFVKQHINGYQSDALVDGIVRRGINGNGEIVLIHRAAIHCKNFKARLDKRGPLVDFSISY